jgi:hypothetical protein
LLTVQPSSSETTASGGGCTAGPNGVKLVRSGVKSEFGRVRLLPADEVPSDTSRIRTQTCPKIARAVLENMRRAVRWIAALALTVLSCTSNPGLVVSHRDRRSRPDQWVRRIAPDRYQIAIDTNGDGKPDLIKTFSNNQLILVERDRNYNGQVDLVQEYSHGVLQREVRDDDFDGKPEMVKTFRPNGSLALIERDPTERGTIDIIEYYDAAGHLIRRVERKSANTRP